MLDPGPRRRLRVGSKPSMDGRCWFRAKLARCPNPTLAGTFRSSHRSNRCWPSSPGRSRRETTTGCSSRSGTGFDASSFVTATGSSSSPASSSRSPATSPSCESRSSGRCRRAASSTVRSWCQIAAITDSTSTRSCSGSIPPSRGSTASRRRPPPSSSHSISSLSGIGQRSTRRCSPDVRCSSTRSPRTNVSGSRRHQPIGHGPRSGSTRSKAPGSMGSSRSRLRERMPPASGR